MTSRQDQQATVVFAGTCTGGIGLGGALTILFIGLRLGHVIEWPWRWILAPAWIPGSLVLLTLIVFALTFAGAGIADARERERRERERRQAPAPGVHGPAHRWGRR